MQNRTVIRFAVTVAVIVLVLSTFFLYPSLLFQFRYRQHKRQFGLLYTHFEAYRRVHGGYLPPDLPALVASQHLEPELQKLIQAGRVSYTAPKDYSGGYDWQLSVDDATTHISVFP